MNLVLSQKSVSPSLPAGSLVLPLNFPRQYFLAFAPDHANQIRRSIGMNHLFSEQLFFPGAAVRVL